MQQLFKSLLFSLHIFMTFPAFFLKLISSFIPLWSEKILDIISVFLNLLKLVQCPRRWFILGNILCALKKYVYSADFGQNVLYTSISKSLWSSVSFKVEFSLFSFCLCDLSIYCGLLPSPPLTVMLSVSPFKSVICFIYFGALLLGAYILINMFSK